MERDIYLEKERVYREEQDSALEKESEDDEPVINSKRHHCQIKNLLKYELYIPNLDSTHLVSNQRKIGRGKSVKITDKEHGWQLVLGEPLEAFDVGLFFQHYPETTGYIPRVRELVRYRVVEWEASEPKDPVHKAKLAKERKAIAAYIAAYCRHTESEEETETKYFCPVKQKQELHAKKARKALLKKVVRQIFMKSLKFQKKRKVCLHKALMITRKKTKTLMFTLMMTRKKTKAPMFTLMMSGKKTKALMFICQALCL